MPGDTSAWIITTDEEGDVDLQPRLCFPRRICISVGKPASQIAESQLRIASCAVNICGKLYVLTAGAEPSVNSDNGIGQGNETWGSSRSGRSGTQLIVQKSTKLGRLVNHPRASQFILIEVSDKFQTCQNQICSECLTPIDNYWAMSRLWPPSHEQVQITALRKGDGTAGIQDLVWTHVANLQYPAENKDSQTFEDYSLYNSFLINTGLPRLSLTDSGSLVSFEGQYIGISIRIMPGFGTARVLLFDDKLWAYLTNLLQVPLGETTAWKHLEDRDRC